MGTSFAADAYTRSVCRGATPHLIPTASASPSRVPIFQHQGILKLRHAHPTAIWVSSPAQPQPKGGLLVPPTTRSTDRLGSFVGEGQSCLAGEQQYQCCHHQPSVCSVSVVPMWSRSAAVSMTVVSPVSGEPDCGSVMEAPHSGFSSVGQGALH